MTPGHSADSCAEQEKVLGGTRKAMTSLPKLGKQSSKLFPGEIQGYEGWDYWLVGKTASPWSPVTTAMTLPTPWEEGLFRSVFHKHSTILTSLIVPLDLLALILKVATFSFF